LRLWIPQQHGAWAMLVVPFFGGVILGGFTPWQIALLPAWILGYAATYHVQQFLRLRRVSRRPEASRRHLAPFGVFFAGFAALAVALGVSHLWLVIAGACLAPFLVVNTIYAWRNRERSLVNGYIAMIPACAMTVVAYRLATDAAGDARIDPAAWAAMTAFVLYFGGTVLYVKTMIRERGSRGYWWASVGYHAVCIAVVAMLPQWFLASTGSTDGTWVWLALPFVWYLVRAIMLPRPGFRRTAPTAPAVPALREPQEPPLEGRPAVRAPVIGAIEVLGSAALLVAVITLR
jgi:hypothetical protein